ncbi:Gfo/Idh/MocA family oxidoreductase [Bacillus sp. FJAT-29790]|uniref:Gfo/Idh/MocA family protein n=1 Tax=Bacillus sp. FJAT-29790 TaxID=1895002 RepID=UPI001C229079|nr:Gfo/Idh/MocA family oxidoreductase [Bacillus sp. FJAT-29790]MBU8880377.1 Gfo/Idh/MocA family oxidoreductase [Bacillus sp. FJAT-29790]
MIRFGVVGTNWITDRLLASVSDMEDFSLAAVYSRTEERAKEFADKYEVQTIFTDIEKMAKSELIDAVYIASPNSFHANHAITFLNNGKHVLCEKPMAANAAEVEAMIEAAKRNNVLLMEAMKTTFLPNFKRIQENLHKIGKARRYVANYCQYSSRYDAYKAGTVLNAFNPVFANGSLMDLGIYCVYPMVVLFGEPKEVKATSVMLNSGVDGEGSLLVKYDEMEAVIMHSKISDSNLPSEIQGEEGSIIIDSISAPEHVEIKFRDGRKEVISVQQKSEVMYYEARAFIDLIKNGQTESAVNSFKQSYLTAKILDAARKEIGLIFPSDK